MSQNKAMVPAAKALEPFRQAFATAQKHFQAAIPETVRRYLTPERLTKITLSALSRNPLLLQCTPESVLRAVMDSASLGLEPTGGVIGHAYLVPYRNGKTGRYEAQLIVGYRGLIDLARRSGTVQSVEAHVVYEGDLFEISFGRTPKLEHKPMLKGDRGDIVAGYCIAELKDGSKQCEVMTIAEIEAVRQRSRAKDNGPWKTDYAEMCRKTVVRRASKYWPLSVEMAGAFEIEDAAEDGGEADHLGPVLDVLPGGDDEHVAEETTALGAPGEASADPPDEAPHDDGMPPWDEAPSEESRTQRLTKQIRSTPSAYRARMR